MIKINYNANGLKYCYLTTNVLLKARNKLAWSVKISLLFAVSTVIFYLYFNRAPSLQLNDLYYDLIQNSTNDKSSADPHCVIPKLNPFDPTVVQYLKIYPRLKCDKIQPAYFDLARRQLVFHREEAVKDLKCQFRCIFKHPIDDLQAGLGDWVTIDLELNSTKIDCEASQVRCQTAFNLKAYENFFYQIIPNHKFRKSIHASTNSKQSRQSSNTGSKSFTNLSSVAPNFIVLGIDSISRSHFIRALPKTYAFLTKEMEALDFLGLNKVGDNTLPNIIPFFTGLPWDQETDGKYNNTFFDDWPIMWKDFASAGYVTLLGEDFPQANIFDYGRRGFVRQPTDHFMRPFFVTAKESSIWRWSSPFCLDTVPQHNILIKAAADIFEEYPFDQPKFVFLFAAEISHQDYNDVTQSDDDWLEFFHTIKPHLHNSFVIMMGDHGYRFGNVRQTLLGQTESRLPAFFMAFPKWFKESYPELVEIAETNSKERLSTFYDVHATALDIARRSWLGANIQNNTTSTLRNRKRSGETPRGISLFDAIPRERTCADAFIPEEFCVCQQYTAVPVDDARIVEASTQMVAHINSVLLASYPKLCAHLELQNITSAAVTLPNRRTLAKAGTENIKMKEISLIFDTTVTVRPSMAVFQGKVQYLVNSDVYTVQGQVERLNLYGNQSNCVSHDTYCKTLCYCI